MRHVLLVAAGLAALLAVALGAAASRTTGSLRSVGPLGLVPPHAGAEVVGHFKSSRPGFPGADGLASPPPPPTEVDNLTYAGHDQPGNGPVMRTNTVFAIYWVPGGYSLPTGYQSTIDRFFTDVAAASGSTSSVYSSDTQYTDTTGQIAYRSTFAHSAVDTDAYPTGNCSEPTDVIGTTQCLGDDQIEAEVKAFADAKGWPHGPNVEFFVFTPQNVGSCFPTDVGPQCAYDVYCAYHSAFFDAGNHEYIYANMPFPNQVVNFGGGPRASDCNSGEHPNGSGTGPSDTNAADEVINVTSHEHNESITDPLGNAWWDDNPSSSHLGDEDGDLCSWSWYLGGPTGLIGGSMTDGSAYNQSINGDHYFIQGEWSNKSATTAGWSGCVWSFVGAPPVNTTRPSITGTAAVGQTLTAGAGHWDGSPTSYAFTWLRCSNTGGSCVTIKSVATTATSTSYTLVALDDRHTIKASVVASNSKGASPPAVSDPTGVVTGEPEGGGATITGTVTVGHTLTGHAVGFSPAPTSYKYTWLRCDNAGAGCTTIKSATLLAGGTSPSYVLAPADDKHTIEISVVATNAAGSSDPATSAPTTVVDGEPEGGGATISGTATVGQTLTGHAAGFSPTPTSYKFTWLRCNNVGASCATITSASTTAGSVPYKLTAMDDKHTIKASVVASNAAGSSDPATSDPTAVVNGEPVNTGLPSITGVKKVGQVLTAGAGTWNPQASSYTYQWLRCDNVGSNCVSIAGAAASTYKPVVADATHELRVRVTASNTAGTGTPAVSGATAPISP
jgi:hypothetical protein